jgi:exonuclease VII large subunit
VRDASTRRLIAERRGVAGTSDGVTLGERRNMADATRNLQHITALLAVSDPRRRGWVLPTRAGGGVVRSAGELAVGEHITLGFHDGAAGAVIKTVPTRETE